jgi:ubiquinone/menaquinone biosynthesis C-methylase UbiE
MWQDWVSRTLPYLNGPVILELGHGPGHLQALLAGRGNVIFGIDLSRQMGRLAIKNIPTAKIPLLTNGDVNYLPYASGSINEVVCTFPTNYITADQVLREIQRVLVHRGKLIILPMAWIKPTKKIYRCAAWLFSITGQAPEHAQTKVTEYFVKTLSEAGFSCQPDLIDLPNSQVLLISCSTTHAGNLG